MNLINQLEIDGKVITLHIDILILAACFGKSIEEAMEILKIHPHIKNAFILNLSP